MGLAAIQIVKATGGMAIATTRGADKKSFLLKAGADHVIVTDEEDLVERGMSLTAGKGVRVVFDPVAGTLLEQLAAVTAPGGIIFEYGALAPHPTPFPLFPALAKGLTIRGYTLFEIVKNPEMLKRRERLYLPRIRIRLLKTDHRSNFPFSRNCGSSSLHGVPTNKKAKSS